MIPANRHMQAIREAAESANRFAGSGGGSGMQPLSFQNDQFTGAINQLINAIGFANAVDVTNSAYTFPIGRPIMLFAWAQVDFAVNAGNTDFVYAYMDLDGALLGHKLFVGTAFEGVCEATVGAKLLNPGNHTIKLRSYVGAAPNQGIIYGADIFTCLMGI